MRTTSNRTTYSGKPTVKFTPSRGENVRVSDNKALIEKSAIRAFIEKDHNKVTFADLEAISGIRKATIASYYKTGKEALIANATKLLVRAQSDILNDELSDKAQNNVLYYASMLALHIYMADRNENIRKLYEAAYLLPEGQEFLYRLLTYRAKDFGTRSSAEYQIASIGILREMIATPTNHYMTAQDKIRHTVRMTLELYNADEESIKTALSFVPDLKLDALSAKVIAKITEQ